MKKKILIIDDSKVVRNILIEIFEKHDYEVVGETGNSAEAVELMKKLSPDIIMLDIMMPDIDGIEILKRIRAENKDVKIIMISSLDSVGTIKECMKEGADHYLMKPFEEDKVMEVMETIEMFFK